MIGRDDLGKTTPRICVWAELLPEREGGSAVDQVETECELLGHLLLPLPAERRRAKDEHPTDPATEDQFSLFRRYLDDRHADGGMADMDIFEFAAMIEETPIRSRVIEYTRPSVPGERGRPLAAVCLTDEIKPHGHLVLAFITSQVSLSASVTDFVIDKSDSDFATTGLKVSSTIRLHRLMTVTKSIIQRELGELSATQQT